MTFTPGHKSAIGRPAGSPNKLTKTVRETFEKVFHLLQKDDKAKLESWAKSNPTEFYKLAAKLIPVDVAVQGGLVLQVMTGVPADQKQLLEEAHKIIDITPDLADQPDPEYDGSDLV